VQSSELWLFVLITGADRGVRPVHDGGCECRGHCPRGPALGRPARRGVEPDGAALGDRADPDARRARSSPRPLVDQANEGAPRTPEWKTAVNYWFRHTWGVLWPLYPGIIVAMSGVQDAGDVAVHRGRDSSTRRPRCWPATSCSSGLTWNRGSRRRPPAGLRDPAAADSGCCRWPLWSRPPSCCPVALAGALSPDGTRRSGDAGHARRAGVGLAMILWKRASPCAGPRLSRCAQGEVRAMWLLTVAGVLVFKSAAPRPASGCCPSRARISCAGTCPRSAPWPACRCSPGW